MPNDASAKKRKKTYPKTLFDDGAVTKVGLGKKCVDGSVILTDDIYGGAIPKVAKGNIFKHNVTDFDEEEENFTLAYSAQTIK